MKELWNVVLVCFIAACVIFVIAFGGTGETAPEDEAGADSDADADADLEWDQIRATPSYSSAGFSSSGAGLIKIL